MKRAVVVFAVLFLTLFLFAQGSYISARGMGRYNDFPGPQLISPILDNIVLSVGSGVKFKWLCGRMAQIDHYEFRLYKGYEMTADTLIIKNDVKPGDCEFELPAESFEVGQFYTWSLKAVFLNGEKGDKSYNTFKIIKK